MTLRINGLTASEAVWHLFTGQRSIPARQPLALLPYRAGPTLPRYEPVTGHERFKCPDCSGEAACACCGGEALHLSDILARFDPDDFGLRRDEYREWMVDLNHEWVIT